MLLDRGFARNSVGRDGNGSNGQGVVSLEREHHEEALWALLVKIGQVSVFVYPS